MGQLHFKYSITPSLIPHKDSSEVGILQKVTFVVLWTLKWECGEGGFTGFAEMPGLHIPGGGCLAPFVFMSELSPKLPIPASQES